MGGCTVRIIGLDPILCLIHLAQGVLQGAGGWGEFSLIEGAPLAA